MSYYTVGHMALFAMQALLVAYSVRKHRWRIAGLKMLWSDLKESRKRWSAERDRQQDALHSERVRLNTQKHAIDLRVAQQDEVHEVLRKRLTNQRRELRRLNRRNRTLTLLALEQTGLDQAKAARERWKETGQKRKESDQC